MSISPSMREALERATQHRKMNDEVDYVFKYFGFTSKNMRTYIHVPQPTVLLSHPWTSITTEAEDLESQIAYAYRQWKAWMSGKARKKHWEDRKY